MKVFLIRLTIALVICWHAGQKLWLAITHSVSTDHPIVPEHSVLEAWVQKIPNFLPILLTLEMGLVLWLISGLFKRSALAVVIVMMAAFTSILTYEIVQEDPRPCGCSKQERLENAREVKKQLAMQIALDVSLMGLAGWGIALLNKKKRRTNLRGGSASGM